ncbi:MAG TPA: F0F1 ATP synthase subunit A [Stellaceae bacterium]|nr:F0F1 ATP synthase subunit A [Stellaceae bacterium]
MHPLAQFTVERILPLRVGQIDVSFTNAALMMAIIVCLITALIVFGTRRASLVPGRLQSVAEISYEFVADMVESNVGPEGLPYFPFVFSLFMFILFSNLLGLIPYSFTVTGQIIVTFALALTVFIGVTIIGFIKHGLHFLRFFVPEGVPIVLLVILVPIEVLSYFIRPFTLSIRLFANMLAGHTMLGIFAGFAAIIGIFAIFPIAIDVVLLALELLVATLQAYVFAILSCLYLNDAIHMH